jgi:hypothetical protein
VWSRTPIPLAGSSIKPMPALSSVCWSFTIVEKFLNHVLALLNTRNRCQANSEGFGQVHRFQARSIRAF